MLVPLRSGELERLIPVVATGNQFKEALGSPRKILQRLMISSIGGVITLLISESDSASQFSSIWLLCGVVFLLYILWGPIVEAGQKNAQLRRHTFSALFDGEIADIYTQERIEQRHEQANRMGELELVENRRTWMVLELEDQEGYLGKIRFPMEKKHGSIRKGLVIRCLVFSNNKNFNRISALSDAWIPSQRIWIGEYPFLLRPAFEDLCSIRLTNSF